MTRSPSRQASPEGRVASVVRALPIAYADDATLARALVDGHPTAAAAAWDQFGPLTRGLLWQTLGPGTDVDDLVQDVFLTLFNRVVTLRDPSALRSFVVGIVVRVAKKELRRRRLRRWLSLSVDGELPEVAEEPADHPARQALSRLYGILDRFDADARLAFVLRHSQGLELTDVAKAMDCSLATAKRRLAKATERLLFHAKRDPALLEVLGAEALALKDDAEVEAP